MKECSHPECGIKCNTAPPSWAGCYFLEPAAVELQKMSRMTQTVLKNTLGSDRLFFPHVVKTSFGYDLCRKKKKKKVCIPL